MKPADRMKLAEVCRLAGIDPANLDHLAEHIEHERHHRRRLMIEEPNAITRRKEIAASTERQRLYTAAYDERADR